MSLSKPLILSISILFTCLNGMAHQAKKLSPKKEIIPPGTVLLSENLFFDMTEISNFSWLEYVSWNKRKHGEDSQEYKNSLPDTTVWGDNTALIKHYFQHPAYHDYPVVGVSYEQALAYCAWRSDRVNEFIFIRENDVTTDYLDNPENRKNIPAIFTYRLPTEEEWLAASAIGFSKRTLRKRTSVGNCYSSNNLHAPNADEHTFTTPTTSYWPNTLGIYNLIGNIAEMVTEKGVSKGGSWKHSLEESDPEQKLYYTGPDNWLGFRCVCERNFSQ